MFSIVQFIIWLVAGILTLTMDEVPKIVFVIGTAGIGGCESLSKEKGGRKNGSKGTQKSGRGQVLNVV